MKKELIIPFALFFAFFTASCSLVGWSEGAKEDYLQRCKDKATAVNIDEVTAQAYCDCALEKTMEEYPNPLDAWGAEEKVMDRIAEECAQIRPVE